MNCLGLSTGCRSFWCSFVSWYFVFHQMSPPCCRLGVCSEVIHQCLYFHQGNHIYVYGCSKSKCLEQSVFGHSLSTNSVHVSNTPEKFEQHIYYYIVFWLTKNGIPNMKWYCAVKRYFSLPDFIFLCIFVTFVKQILILEINNPGKYKMQFLHDDCIYWGENSKLTWPYVKK